MCLVRITIVTDTTLLVHPPRLITKGARSSVPADVLHTIRFIARATLPRLVLMNPLVARIATKI